MSFMNVRKLLLNPGDQEEREKVSQTTATISAVSGVAFVAGIGTSILGFMISGSYPILGSLVTVTGLGVSIVSRECSVMSQNCHTLMTESIFSRASSSLSEEKFVSRLTQNTWIVDPLFKPLLTESIKNAN